jgi:AbrB family looped-hinge helix DNA binding protein
MTDILRLMGYSVGTKGQVVIPKQIRDALHITPGQEMIVEQRGDEIVLRKSAGTPLLGRFAGVELTALLRQDRRDDRERDDRRS